MILSANDAAVGAYAIKDRIQSEMAAQTLIAAGELNLVLRIYKAIGLVAGFDRAISALISRLPQRIDDGSLFGSDPAEDPVLEAHIAALRVERKAADDVLKNLLEAADAVADRVLRKVQNVHYADGAIA